MVLNPLISLEVPLHQMGNPFLVDQLEGVGREPVHVSEGVGCAAVGEEDDDLVEGFGDQGEEVPVRVSVFEVRLGVALLGVNKVWEL